MLVVLLSVGLLVGLGTAAGYGIGRAVDVVRDVWPEAGPDLTSDKALPPEPIDLTGPAEACTAGAVALDLTAGATTLVKGEVLPFTLRVTNEGRVPCLLDGRGTSMQVVVTDDEGERVWSSADCGAGGGSDLLLGARNTLDTWDTTVRWSGASSKPGCEGERARVPAGEYTATMTLADVPDAVGDPVTVTVVEPPAKESAEDDEKPADEKSGDDEEPAGESSD